MKINCNKEELKQDIYDIAHLFYPEENLKEDGNVSIFFVQNKKPGEMETCIEIRDADGTIKRVYNEGLECCSTHLQEKKILRRNAKLDMYKTLMDHTGKDFPWGSLTGIRPTKLARELIEEGVDPDFIEETMIKTFLVSEEKARLISRILKNQRSIIRNDSLIDLYINIPVCPSRCSYCSFISSELSCVKNLMPIYLEKLIEEINEVKKIISNKPYVVRTVYIGGGTPTVLTASELDMLLRELNYPISEFTVECGRPDTITEEKLKVLNNHGVTRISINPQTFSSKTLKMIGRKHTIKDVLNAYSMALKYGFKVNMDMIAGLPGESFRTFKKNIDTLLELSPDNITIHTLSIKRGSNLVGYMPESLEVKKMVDYSYKKLTENEYRPYYMYRQKNQLGGLENVGYCKDSAACIFNIDSMEETCSIIACGANAISKRIYHDEKRIERQANVKFLQDYINRIDEMIYDKKILFK